jgi:hypothetical protein
VVIECADRTMVAYLNVCDFSAMVTCHSLAGEMEG